LQSVTPNGFGVISVNPFASDWENPDPTCRRTFYNNILIPAFACYPCVMQQPISFIPLSADAKTLQMKVTSGNSTKPK
jgi:hypothetical protein